MELNGIYRGVIEDNSSDPEKMGRCKVRIFSVHTPNKKKEGMDGIPTDELPWAEPVMGLFEGSVSGFGSWTVPLQGSHVFVFFEGGDLLQPKYFATIPGKPTDQNHGFTKEQGFSDPDGEYPIKSSNAPHEPNELEESDFHRLARGEITDTIVESKNSNKETGIYTVNGNTWDEPDSAYNASYPNNKVFASNSGITIEIDDTPDNERIHLYHPSNTFIEIDVNGNINIKNSGNRHDITKGTNKKYTNEDSHETVKLNRYVKVQGKCEVEVGGDYDLTIGGNFNVDAGGDFNFNGSTFNWNQ